jgi:hypothetical protein
MLLRSARAGSDHTTGAVGWGNVWKRKIYAERRYWGETAGLECAVGRRKKLVIWARLGPDFHASRYDIQQLQHGL